MNSETFNTETSKVLQKALYYRCEDLCRIFDKSSVRDLHGFFPQLLGSIFGYSGCADWGLRNTYTNSSDAQVLRQFLSPYGPLFKLIDKLQADGFLRYEFFVQCLPLATQRSLAEGVVTALYHNKIQIGGTDKSPAVVSLNAFEYYMFHFAYFLVHQQNTELDTEISSSGEVCVFTAVLEQYLQYFFPTDGTPSQSCLSQSSASAVTRTTTQCIDHVIMPYIQAMRHIITIMLVWITCPMRHGDRRLLSRPNTTSTTTGRNSMGSHFSGLIRFATFSSSHAPHHHHHVGLDHMSYETWRSETFIQILCEFWLNQNTMDSVSSNVFSHGQEYFLPTIEHMWVVRMLVKHIHMYVYANGPDPIHLPLQSLPTATDELKRSVIPQVIQKKLYCFLRHSFAHWPLDPSFRIVLETWLSYVQPWRYSSYSRLANNKDNDESRIAVAWVQWKPFVMDNYLFYTALLLEFMSRATRFDLFSSKDAQLLFRTAKVLAQRDLLDIIEEGEDHLLLPSGGMKRPFRGSPSSLTTSAASSLRTHILEMEGPSFIYTPVLHEQGSQRIKELYSKVACTISQIKTSQQRLQLNQSRSTNESLMSRLKSFFEGDFDGNYNRKEDRKVLTFLEPTIRDLAMLGKLSLDATDSGDGTIGWQSGISRDNRPTPYVTSSNSTLPDCVETERGLVLTSHGKYQVINGIRKFELRYTGDPELQPIRSFENAFLVRFLHRVSLFLNSKLEGTLENIYNKPGLVGSVACYMSPALTSSPSQDPLSNSPITRRQSPPGRIYARISLRFLASYKVLFYLLLLIVLCKFVSLNSFMVLAIFCFVLFFMVLFNALPAYEKNERYRKKIT